MKPRLLDYCIGGVALIAFLFLIVENTAFGDAHASVFRVANLVVLVVFASDVACRFLVSKDKKQHLRAKWFDLIVFVPLTQYIPALRGPNLFVIIRQIAIVVMLISRSRRAGKLVALLSMRPAQLMVIGFLGALGIGTVLLMLPIATCSGARMALVDAAFTATSAVCVTGLAVQDTATYFSRFGQLVILALIQAGGLGIMTFSVSLVVFTGRRMDVKRRAALQDVLDHDTLSGVGGLVRFIVLMTLAFEAIGAVVLFAAWRGKFDGPALTAYHSIFHSISAFCNAGFSTLSDSLMRFSGDVTTNAVICFLVVAGGLGFMVIRDMLNEARDRFGVRRYIGHKTRVQTKIVLTVTALLVLFGAMFVYLTERHGVLGSSMEGERILCSVFQSITARTAGFNTMDIGKLTSATLLVSIILMFIGASPGSTGGGIKTTTAAALWAAVAGNLRNRENAELYHRTIPQEVVQKAMTVLCFALVIVLCFAVALMHLENRPFLDVLFETVSAFGTVGLSMGITPGLTLWGKVLVTALMFIGRLGPLTVAYALVGGKQPGRYEYAEERVMIG